jgi:hypothetical protein
VALPVANATAGTALRIIWPHKPSHLALAFDKVGIPWRDVEADLRAMQIMNWRTRIEDKLAWKKIVEQAKIHPGL